MRYDLIDAGLFIQNRKRLSDKLLPHSIALVCANDVLPSNADGHLPFKQNTDLFYLTGIDQEESILLFFPDAFEAKHRCILFLKETNAHIAVWEGNKLSKEEAFEISGISSIYWLQDFDKILRSLIFEAQHIYLNTNEHLRASAETATRQDRFLNEIKQLCPLHRYERLAPLMHELRSVKSLLEIDIMQTAADITEKAFRRVLPFVKPGVMEYEIEAEFAHEFIRNRSNGFAYAPIIASGKNACILHYTQNKAACQAGDLLLLDVGAEYANYNADMTRCIPVSGQFSARQKQVYAAVLRIMRAACKLLKPGVFLNTYQQQVGALAEKELVDLGLLTLDDIKNQSPNFPAYKKYFMHGASHFLGLDVHDLGLWHQPIRSGMVFTVEPGIYIPAEGLGIRLENNILITNDSFIDLMQNIPIEIAEIEELMRG